MKPGPRKNPVAVAEVVTRKEALAAAEVAVATIKVEAAAEEVTGVTETVAATVVAEAVIVSMNIDFHYF